jgi:hypothetical protein
MAHLRTPENYRVVPSVAAKCLICSHATRRSKYRLKVRNMTMQVDYKIVKRDNGETLSLYDSETEDIIATVTADEYMAYKKIAYAIGEYIKMKGENYDVAE